MVGVLKNQRDLYKKKEAMVRIEGTATVKKAGFSRDVLSNTSTWKISNALEHWFLQNGQQ